MENSTMQRGPEQWFLDAHPERGSVRVQVSTGRGLFPVEGARVEIYRRLGPEPTVFYEGVTDASGHRGGYPPAGAARRVVPVGGDGGHQRYGVSGVGAPPAARHGGGAAGDGVPPHRNSSGGVAGRCVTRGGEEPCRFL